ATANRVEFSPHSNQLIVSSSDDKTVRMWRIEFKNDASQTSNLLQYGCNLLREYLETNKNISQT
ncbi:MAG TPA: hypothetical protein DCP31_37975, partial [Cyanobacteria bacterium UBA8543]|nr:hypothetical protein [Cyanobacteria bacterium UBA8543]